MAPSDAAFGLSVSGSPDPLQSGGSPSWGVGVTGVPAGAGDDALDALARPVVTAALSGAHTVKPGSVRTAPGWSAEPGHRLLRKRACRLERAARGGGHAAAGQAAAAHQPGNRRRRLRADPRRIQGVRLLPPLGSDVGDVHRSHDGQPLRGLSDSHQHEHDLGARSGSRRRKSHLRDPPAQVWICPNRPLGLYCWDAAAAQPCGYVVVGRFPSVSDPGASGPVVVAGKVYMVGDGGKLYCVDPATNLRCTAYLDRAAPGSRRPLRHHLPRFACLCVTCRRQRGLHRRDRRRRVPRLGAPQAAAGRSLERRKPLQRAGPGDGRVPRRQQLGGLLRRRQPSLAYGDRLVVQPSTSQYDTEAETGSRTLVAGDNAGVACWDWVTLAPCTGGGL